MTWAAQFVEVHVVDVHGTLPHGIGRLTARYPVRTVA
jgi:hypothetical protein